MISYANVYANGVEFSESNFSGGTESNDFLRGLGFEIVPKDSALDGDSEDQRGETQAWLFQANPDLFDLDGYLRAETDITWTSRQGQKVMRVGDRVFIWRASGSKTKAQAGVVASGILTAEPRMRPEDSAALPYWRGEKPWGWAGAPMAQNIHKQCVKDFKRLGFVALPNAAMGVEIAPNSNKVNRVLRDSGAEKAGIHVDDLITEIDGQSVSRLTEILLELADKRPGDTVTVTIDRSGKTSRVPVRLGKPVGE